MKLPILFTLAHQDKTLEINEENESITLRGPFGEHMGQVNYASLIEFIQTKQKEGNRSHSREFPRVPLEILVKYCIPQGSQFQSLTNGVSGGGLFVETSEPLPTGSRVPVEFSLPDHPKESIAAQAEVMWVRRKPERLLFLPGMGLRFKHISEESRKKVQELVSDLNCAHQ